MKFLSLIVTEQWFCSTSHHVMSLLISQDNCKPDVIDNAKRTFNGLPLMWRADTAEHMPWYMTTANESTGSYVITVHATSWGHISVCERERETNPMSQSPCWEATGQHISRRTWNRRFITVSTTVYQWFLSCSKLIQYTTSHNIFLRTILILPSHQSLYLRNGPSL
jgi:hypothetical protein